MRQSNNFDCGLFVMKYLTEPVSMQRSRYMVSLKRFHFPNSGKSLNYIDLPVT